MRAAFLWLLCVVSKIDAEKTEKEFDGKKFWIYHGV
jgi:hypothetical protein